MKMWPPQHQPTTSNVLLRTTQMSPALTAFLTVPQPCPPSSHVSSLSFLYPIVQESPLSPSQTGPRPGLC